MAALARVVIRLIHLTRYEADTLSVPISLLLSAHSTSLYPNEFETTIAVLEPFFLLDTLIKKSIQIDKRDKLVQLTCLLLMI